MLKTFLTHVNLDLFTFVLVFFTIRLFLHCTRKYIGKEYPPSTPTPSNAYASRNVTSMKHDLNACAIDKVDITDNLVYIFGRIKSLKVR